MTSRICTDIIQDYNGPDVDNPMEEAIGFKTRIFSMLVRLLTLMFIAGALYISTDGIFVVLLLFVGSSFYLIGLSPFFVSAVGYRR